MTVTHLAFNFSFWRKRGNRVDDDHINGTRTHQHVTDFQCLLARIRLRHQQVINLNAKRFRVNRIQCVLSINERTGFSGFLSFCDNLQCQRGFTARFRSVNFNDTSKWQTTDAEGDIKP